jgi:hypothetical protein
MVALHGVPPSSQYNGSSDWIMDMSASSHMVNNTGILTSSSPPLVNTSIIVGNGAPLPVHHFGSFSPTQFLPLNNVLIPPPPNLIKNLISVRALTRDNFVSITFDPFGFSRKDFKTGTTLLQCDSTGELYPLCPSTNNRSSSGHGFLASHNTELWDAWLDDPGHIHLHRILARFDFQCSPSDNHTCDACRVGKHIRLTFSDSSNVSLFPFQLLHCDVWTSPIISNSGFKFYLVVLDDFSHFLWAFPLRQKSDMLPTLIAFHAFIHTQFQRPIMCIQTNNGKEFDNHVTRSFFLAQGIAIRLTYPYTLQQRQRIRCTSGVCAHMHILDPDHPSVIQG